MSIVDDLTKPSLSVNVVKGSTKSFTRYSTSCDSISVHSQFDGPLDILKNMSMGKPSSKLKQLHVFWFISYLASRGLPKGWSSYVQSGWVQKRSFYLSPYVRLRVPKIIPHCRLLAERYLASRWICGTGSMGYPATTLLKTQFTGRQATLATNGDWTQGLSLIDLPLADWRLQASYCHTKFLEHSSI